MKKSVSFCFLSILLVVFGLLPKIAQGQQACDCLWLENIDPNVSSLELTTLEAPVSGETDIYRIHFDTCTGYAPDTKVSLEWEIYRDGELLGNDLSRYAEVKLKSKYNRINDGYLTLSLPSGECPTITPPGELKTYPGAIKVFPGINLAEYSLDFFYLHFFQATENLLEVKWNYIGDYTIVLKLVERLNGTDYPSFYYTEDQRLNIGGHQSIRGTVMATETFQQANRIPKYDEICSDARPYLIGNPQLSFNFSDTLIITDVAYYNPICTTKMDSIIELELVIFPELETPQVTDMEFCENDESDTLSVAITQSAWIAQLDNVSDIVLEWKVGTDGEWSRVAPIQNTDVPGTYYYYVRYAMDGEQITCSGDSVKMTVIVHPAPPHVFPSGVDMVEYCINGEASALQVPEVSGTHAEWFVNNAWITTAPTPRTNVAGMTKYLVRRVDSETGCISASTDTVKVHVYELPVVGITANDNPICHGYELELTASGADTYVWNVKNSSGNDRTDTVLNVTALNTFTYQVTGTENHFEISCANTASLEVIVRPEIMVTMDTVACNGQEFTVNPIVASTVAFAWNNGLPKTLDTAFVNTGNEPIYVKWGYTLTDNTTNCTKVDTMVIQVGPVPSAHLIPAIDTVCAEVPFNMIAVDSFEYANPVTLTYLWDNGSTDNSAEILFNVAGDTSVTVKITNEYQCSDYATANVHVSSAPVSGIVAPDTICQYDEITLTAVGDYEFYWENTGETTREITFIMAVAGDTTFTLLAKDSITDCSKYFTHTIFVNPAPNYTPEPDKEIYCEGESVTLEAIEHAAGETYTYVWTVSPDVTISGNPISFVVDLTETFYVTATNTATGCQRTDSVTVTVNPLPRITYEFTPNTLPDAPLCNGEIFRVTANAGSGMSYKWMHNPSQGPTLSTTVRNSDTIPVMNHYPIEVVDLSTSCVKHDTVSITIMPTPRPVIVASANVICADDFATLSLTKEYASYSWSTGETTPSIEVNSAGPFNVTVSDLAGCSAASSNFSIIVNPLPQITLVSKTPGDTICEQDASLYMEVSAGAINAAYVWSYNGLTTPAITVPAERVFNNTNSPINMDFFVTVTNTYTGCRTIDTITYVVNPNPQPIIVFDIPNNDNRICLGDSVTLRAEDYRDYDDPDVLTHYQWTHNSSHDTVLVEWPMVTTIYTLSATNTYMCRKMTSDTVNVMPKRTIEILTEDGQPLSDTICPNTTVRLVASPSNLSLYDWGNGFTSDPFLEVTAPGKYAVVADDPNGCTIMSDTFRLYTYDAVDFSLAGASTVCTPQSYTLYAHSNSGAEYEFTWPDGTTSTSNTTVSWTTDLDDYGDYEFPVSARNILTNCVAVDTAIVNVVNLPGMDLSITHSEDTICAGEEVMFFASVKAGVSYMWGVPAVGTNDTAKAILTVGGANVITLTIEDDVTGCENTAADTVYVYPVLDLVIENPSERTAICVGTTTQLIATSAFADATFAWYADNSTTPFATTDTINITPDNTTLYTVIATSSKGCTEFDTMRITVNPLPQYVTTAKDILACIGANVEMSVIQADAGTTYLWSDLSTNSTITKTVTKDTVFTVNIQALNGCAVTETFTIEAQFLGTELAFTDSVCLDNDVTFTVANPNGISSNTVYTWNGETGTNPYQIRFTSPGHHAISLVMTDAVTGCTVTIDTTIFVFGIPGTGADIALKTICHGDQVTLEGPMNGGMPYQSYLWFNDSTTKNITIVPDVSNAVDTFYYAVTVFDGNCYNTVNASVAVNPTPGLNLTIVEGNTVCHGETVRVVATPADPTQNYIYLWGNTIGTDTLFATPANASDAIITETYTLTLTNLSTGCQTVESIDLDVRPAPVVDIYTEYPYFCKGDYGVLDADRAEQFVAWNWSTGENTRSIYVDTAGTYIVTVTDIHGCTAVDTYIGPEVIDVKLNISASNTVVCANSSVTITATPDGNTVPVDITWYFNTDSVGVGTNFNTGNLINTTGDTLFYEFTAVGIHALPGVTCIPTETITIAVLPLPDPVVVGAVNDTIFACLADGSVTLNGYDATDYTSAELIAYAWALNGNSASDNADEVAPFVFNYTTPGQYDGTLTLTNSFGCSTAYSFMVNVVDAIMPQIVSENGKHISDTVCAGENLTLSVATQGNNWIWNGVTTSRTLNLVNLQGDTTVTVAATSGCYGVGSYFVKVNPLPAVATMQDTTVCGNATINLAVQSPESDVIYIWINTLTGKQDTTALATISVGSYVITAVNTITGCASTSDTFNVTSTPLPVAEFVVFDTLANQIANPLALCVGTGYEVYANAAAGNTYNFTIDGDAVTYAGMDTMRNLTMPNRDVAVTLTVIDNTTLCQNTITDTIRVNEYPLIDVTKRTFTACANETSSKIYFTPQNINDDYDYNWVGYPSAGDTLEATLNGTSVEEVFYAQISNGGCPITDSITVLKRYVALTATPYDTVCRYESLTMIATPVRNIGEVTYTWNIADSTRSQLVVNTETAGDYTYTVTATDNGCVTSATKTIHVRELPVFAVNSTDENDTICMNDDMVLFVESTATLSYTWISKEGLALSYSANNDTITVDYISAGSGAYTFYVTASDGNCDKADSIVLVVNALPAAEITSHPTDVVVDICQFAIDTIKAAWGADYTYVWSHTALDSNEVAVSFDNVVADTVIYLTVTDRNGCEFTDSVVFDVQPLPVLSFTEAGQRCDTITLSVPTVDGYTYTWSFVDAAGNTVNLPDAAVYSIGAGTNFDTTLVITVSGIATLVVNNGMCDYVVTDTVEIFTDPTISITPVGLDTEIYSLDAFTGTQVQFDIIVRNECGFAGDTAVSINYVIYKDDVAVGTGHRAMGSYMSGNDAIRYFVNRRAGDTQIPFGSTNNGRGYYDMNATGNIPAGEFVTNSGQQNLGRLFQIDGANGALDYTWFFMHFLEERRITVTFDNFTADGVYRIEYELVKHNPLRSTGYSRYEPIYATTGTYIGGHEDPQGRTLAYRTMILNIGVNPNPTPNPILPTTVSAEMAVYPNPVQDKMMLEVKNVEAGAATVIISDLRGNVLEKFDASIEDAEVTKIERYLQANYANGTYVVALRKGSAVKVSSTIVIMK